MIKNSWSKISLIFFFIIALLGSIIRLAPFSDIIFSYKHLIHAHSHVAFQGWVYSALFLLITKLFLTEKTIKTGKYHVQYYLTLITVFGLMVSFIIQGYGFFSILFSSLFQILNYWFAYRFFKDIKKSDNVISHLFSLKFIKIGFWMMLLSTIGPWVVGILSAKGLNGSEYSNAALYFFLHFQYNGWFTFAILGLFFFFLEKHKIPYKQIAANSFFIFITASVIPSYALSLMAMSFKNYVIVFGYISAILQILSLYYLYKSLKGFFATIKTQFNYWSLILLKMSILTFILKIVLQFTSAFPVLEDYIFSNHFLIMAYIHLVIIGFISYSLLAIFFQLNWYKSSSLIIKIGIFMLVIGFIFSELLLVLIGLEITLLNNLLFLFGFSATMAIGILLILISQFTNSTTPLSFDNESG